MGRKAIARIYGVTLMSFIMVWALDALAQAAPGNAPALQFRAHQIVDQQQGGLVLATITVPAQWHVSSRVLWTYSDVSHPVRAIIRAEAPDQSAWVEFFPIEIFYWLEPVKSSEPFGRRSLGMIYAPHIGARQAVQQFVVVPYRGKQQSLRIVNVRPVDPARLAAGFGQPPVAGEAVALRLNYVTNGQPAEEDVYGEVGRGNRIPFTGPQGTWYESHRPLIYAHALGAANGALDSVYPLLTFIAGSLKIDPAWETHRQQVMKVLQAEFDKNISRGYAQIQAAAQLSRTISANNDAMLGSMQAQRQAQAQRDAARRASAASASSPNDSFSQYLRGTERMKDPYWGESDRPYSERYHWTDGSGNYRSSNDASFNPNVGSGGGPTWQRMEPAR
jgi:hypothetical protein